MLPDVLDPNFELLRKEYVLVQAWKKTASYIRYHNWFSDTLELDWATVNLPSFLAEIAERLESPAEWKNCLLRLVPAPKSQRWHVSSSGTWKPESKLKELPMRPLAHISLQDQVVATALMLCLANRVETEQGDTRKNVRDVNSRQRVTSYGNRLFCDEHKGKLHHRWGSAKLYRSYYEDYKSFIFRPEAVAKSIEPVEARDVYIVHSDLKNFYDRVHPYLLAAALENMRNKDDDTEFFDFAKQFFCWTWHQQDIKDIENYSKQTGINDFSQVVLPQGLVSAGFLSNLVLLLLDRRLRSEFGKEISPSLRLEDVCRYVDDLRFVMSTKKDDYKPEDVKEAVINWLTEILENEAPSLALNEDKTQVTKFGSNTNPPIRLSEKMNRIQSAVSGGFDMIGGEEILTAIQALTRHALRNEAHEPIWPFSPVPDVQDATVLRFSASRFRTTYRSLRPLLEENQNTDTTEIPGIERPFIRNKYNLDEDARAYALGLIERWVEDPSNVRLLRIGLDIRPDPQILREILKMLRPLIEKKGQRKTLKQVAWYCLAELFRAGATETGLVNDEECLPDEEALEEYRRILCEEASRVSRLPARQVPWYLRQQALLFLTAFDPNAAEILPATRNSETRLYRKMIAYLGGSNRNLKNSDFATLAVLSRRTFLDAEQSIALAQQSLTAARKKEIALRDPSFALELGDDDSGDFGDELPMLISEPHSVKIVAELEDHVNLAEIVLTEDPKNSLRNELSLLHFVSLLLSELQKENREFDVIRPEQVWVKLGEDKQPASIKFDVSTILVKSVDSLYCPPNWAELRERWRFHLGFLLRYILTGQTDFTKNVRSPHWKEGISAYRPAKSHWYQRLYGLFNGQPAFGDDWLPISEWMENFLLALLHWPGCRIHSDFIWVKNGTEEAKQKICNRIEELELKRGDSTGTLLIPMTAGWPTSNTLDRPLRACVVQTVIPTDNDLKNDPKFSKPANRRRHRNHLSAALAAVRRMLALRETHEERDWRLDWLILPELAVHPSDVTTHLIPFARAHRTLILTGLTYEELFQGKPLVNSALWILPEWSPGYGLQIRTRRQGKFNLAPDEKKSIPNLQGFRPCQWLVGYPWSINHESLWLTASICYDATDLKLAAQLRNESDVFAIPALNQDVKTFDQMALALHYHMFQIVIVANNGKYGGSNAYWPLHGGDHQRQIFHLHGQPQASIAFLEIDNIEEFTTRGNNTPPQGSSSKGEWKCPPAGWRSNTSSPKLQ